MSLKVVKAAIAIARKWSTVLSFATNKYQKEYIDSRPHPSIRLTSKVSWRDVCRTSDCESHAKNKVKYHDVPVLGLAGCHQREFLTWHCSEMAHTDSLPQEGGKNYGPDTWDEGEDEREMEMRRRWEWNYKLPNRDTRREMQKRTAQRENTNTNTRPSPERANPERAREKKKRTDDGPNTDQRRGGGRKRLTQPTRREPNLPRHAKHPNLT